MKQNTTYKQTELGLIPEDWEVKKLGELGFFFKGKGVPKTSIETEGKYKCLTYGDLYTKYDYVIKNVKSFINDASDSQEINFGDICIAGSGETIEDIGKCAVFIDDKTGYAGGDIIIFRSDENPLTLSYILNSDLCKRQKYRLGQGHSVVHIYSSQLQNLKIPLPPLPEQKKIADCLSTWDVAIEKQSALINALTDRKKALMQQLLTGKKRLPGFSGEWKEVKLGNLFEKINRKNEEGNTNVVTISAQRGFVKQTDFFNKSVASETLDNYSLIYHGEFCYNKSYSNGYPLGATKRLIAFEKAVVTTLYICFKIKDQKKSNGSFFEQFFEANSLDRSLIKIAQEGGRAHGLLNVSLSDFFNIKIKLPPIEEQTAIAEILAAADRELQLQKEKLAQLQTQKKGLMQVLLTGKKRLMN